MLLESVIGQNKIKQHLRNVMGSQRIPHAFLFLGPAGCGKLALAIAFGQYLLCERPTKTDACGKCSSCQKAAKLIHPDLHFSFPTIGRNVISDRFAAQWRETILENPYISVTDWLEVIGGEGKATLQGNINKDECLNIIKKLGLKSFENDRKVMIIWMPEFLQKEGNRLLKIIEEPPDNTFFILVAEQQESILNTILSRCQLLKIPLLTDEEIVQGLEQLNVPGERAAAVAPLTNGNFATARKMAAKQQDNITKEFVVWLRKCYIGNGVDLVQWVDNISQITKQNQKYLLQYGMHFIREFMVMKFSNAIRVRLDEEEKEAAFKLQNIIGTDQAEELVKLLVDCYYSLERNGNSKILFLDTSIQFNRIMRNA